MSFPSKQLKIGVLGATGTVGQKFIVLLENHPNFKIHALGASSRSAGRRYVDAVKWKQVTPIPEQVKNMIVHECVVGGEGDKYEGGKFEECDLVFSGLDSDVAGDVEAAFRDAGLTVFSNAKNYRRDPLVPLVVPLVNGDHLSMIHRQKQELKSSGYILTNANCSTTALVVPLKALEDAFGPLSKVVVSTMQAISGGGYPGVPSLDILGNVVPYISGEEEKMEWETSKILGGVDGSVSDPKTLEFDHRSKNPLLVSAHCSRVPVIDGHTETVSVQFQKQPPPTPEQVIEALKNYTCEPQAKNCPSAPKQAITIHDAPDRPQPRLDSYEQNGAGVSVGRVRTCPVFDIRFVVLANNVNIGAATSSIINAELALANGYL